MFLPFRAVSADLFRLDARFEKYLSIESEGGCWIWTGYAYTGNGNRPYGSIWVRKRKKAQLVHRYVYSLVWGPIPFRYEIHHTCVESLCCNPNHLVALTREEHAIEHGGWVAFFQRTYYNYKNAF